VAENVVIEDELDLEHFDIVSPTGLPINGRTLRYPIGQLAYKDGIYDILRITVRLKNPLASGTTICNASSMTSTNVPTDTSEKECVDVINPCVYDTKKNEGPDCVEPKLVCKLVDSAINYSKREVTFKTTATTTNAAVTLVKEYQYDYDSDGKIDQKIASDSLMNTIAHVYAPGKHKATVKVVYIHSVGSKKNVSQETQCSAAIEFEKDAPFGQAKTVTNATKNLSGDAAVTPKVNGGDVLEYTLTTTNSQNFDRENITISDYIGDILDYADLDSAFLKEQGGTFDEASKKVLWSGVTLPGSKNLEKRFRVIMKNPVPATNQPSSVSTDYDCKISNQYGNEITLEVQCPAVKSIETIYKTGPGTSLTVGFIITAFIGYFFSRSRLMAKELSIISNDYATSGS
jgi:hypothetical protein